MTQPAVAVDRVARLTAVQVHAMLDSGILRDAEGLELIDGLLVYKDRAASGADPMTIGEKHHLVIKLLARLDARLVAQGAHMQTQGPVRLSDRDEPEPDGAIVRGEPRDYADRIPTSRDVTCILEVADSSLEYDRTIKAALYANAGIAQYVIVNLRDLCLEVRESPAGEQYGDLDVVAPARTVELRAAAGVIQVPVVHLLP